MVCDMAIAIGILFCLQWSVFVIKTWMKLTRSLFVHEKCVVFCKLCKLHDSSVSIITNSVN